MDMQRSATEKSTTFSNGLLITPSQVRLGDQTWAVGQIKNVGIEQAGTGLGIFFWGLFALAFAYSVVAPETSGYSPSGGAMNPVIALMLSVFFGYLAYRSWVSVKSKRVWIKTGTLRVNVFRSRENSEAERVKQHLQDAISCQTASNQ